MAENALLFAENNYGKALTKNEADYLTGLWAQWNQINLQKNNTYIKLFKSANMQYTVFQDGIINYQFTQ